MSVRIIDWKSGVATTTDAATPATICESDNIPTGATATVDVYIQGRDAAGNIASTSFQHRARNVGGTLTLVGSITNLVTMALGSDAALSTAAASITSVAGPKLRLQVNGVVATTIEWFGDVRVRVN